MRTSDDHPQVGAARSRRWPRPARSSPRRSRIVGEQLEPGITTGELDRLAEEFIRVARRRRRPRRATAATRPRSASRRTTMVVHGIPGAYERARGRHDHGRRRRHARRLHRRLRRTRSASARSTREAQRLLDVVPGGARGRDRRRPGRETASATSRAAVQQRRRGGRLLGRPQPRRPRRRPRDTTRTRRSRTSASPGRGPLLSEGMTLAIEPMITAGRPGRVRPRRRVVDLDRGRLARGPLRAHRRDHRRQGRES